MHGLDAYILLDNFRIIGEFVRIIRCLCEIENNRHIFENE